jgi:hypothetical protein
MLYNSENINVLAEIVTKTPNKRGIRTYEFKYRGNYSSRVHKKSGEGDIYSIIGLVTDFILKEREIGFDYFWELYISG